MTLKSAPKPNSFMDSVSLRHDREVPKANLTGCHHNDSVCREQLFRANLHFMKDAMGELATGPFYSIAHHRFITPRNLGQLGALAGDWAVALVGYTLFSLDNLQMMVRYGTGLGRMSHTTEFWHDQKKYLLDGGTIQLGALNAFISTSGSWTDKQNATNQYIQNEINNRIQQIEQNYIRFLVFGH